MNIHMMYRQMENKYWDDATSESFQKPDNNVQRPNNIVQKPDSTVQKPGYSVQKPSSSVQRPRYSGQKPGFIGPKPVNNVHKPDNSVQKPDNSFQKPELAKRAAMNTEKDREMTRSQQGTYTVQQKRPRQEVYEVEQASIKDGNEGLRSLGRQVVYVEDGNEGLRSLGSVHEIGERLEGEDEDNSDSQESDIEPDSDISDPASDNDDGMCPSQPRHGSYNFIYAEAETQRGKVTGTDSEGEFQTEGESTSISSNDSDSYHSNIDDGEVMSYGGDGVDVQIPSSTAAEFRGVKEDKSGILVSTDKEGYLLRKSKDIQEQSSRSSHKNRMSMDNKIVRTPSYQRACSRESTSSETFDNDHFDEDCVESESDSESFQRAEQLDSVEGAEDPHGLIRKPAVRRKGFAWTSKSMPINSKATRMKQQQRKQNFDSSLDLGPSLLTLYDHRIAAGTRDGDNEGNDVDDMLIDIGEAPKTNSLPVRANRFTIDGSQYNEKRESPQRLSTGRQEVVVNNDPLGHTALDDAKKRPLSISSASSNSFTYSPRLRKKKTIGFSGDDHGVSVEDLQGSNKAAVRGTNSKTSTFDSRASVDSGFVQRTKDGDIYSDRMSITSSETDSLGNEAESNLAKDCSRMPSSASNALNVSQSNKPLPGCHLNSSISGPGYTDYNNTSFVLVALDGQPGTPSSCSEMGRAFPDPQSPVIRAYTKTGRPTKSDISRHSTTSTSSRHEARMKFYSNYEEYMSQPSPPQVSNMEENLRISSESQPGGSSINSTTPTTTSESASETKDTNHRHLQASAHTNTVPFTPSSTTSSEGGRETITKMGRRSERTSRRSDRRGSNSKHEGFSSSSRSGFSRSSKKRDLTAASDAGSRSNQGYTSYVFRAVTEIIESERTYIASLEDIIHGYLEPMERMLSSNEAKKDIEVLFSNIRDIYKFGCTFLADLEIASTDCVKVAQCFVRHNKGFVIYTDYCTNYPRAVEVLTRFMQHPELSELCKERQLALGHGLPLGAYLLRPVQRILKYHLLLQNIVKNCEKEKAEVGIIEQAFHHMTEMAHHINEMKRKHEHAVRIQEIQSQLEDYSGEDLTRLGELVLEGTFKIYGAKASRQVFLFERGLLICKKSEGAMLSCKAYVLCSNLMLVEVIPNEPLSFHIIPFNNPRAQYTLQARNMEQKRLWCQNIKELILESFKGRIPDNVKNLIMQLGREHDDDYVSKEAMEAGRKNQHTAPEYLEKRKVRGKSGSRIPDFSLLRPQKAKRGGNKKVDLRPGHISPEVNRRAKSKSPERHHLNLSRQNAAKSRSLSTNSPAKPVAAFCKLIPNPVHAIAQADDKTAAGSPPTPECTSPESPVYRKSRKFTYFKNSDGESPTSGKAAEIPKRPLSFLMARANPILSADLTQLLARCGGSIEVQSPALPNSEDNDKIHPSHGTIEEYGKHSLTKTSDTNKALANDQQYDAEETNLVQDSKFSEADTSLSANDNTESHTATETTAVIIENDSIALGSSNHKSVSEPDCESISSLTKEVLDQDVNKTCECDEKNETHFEKSNDVSESADPIYENVNISVERRDKHNNDQSCIKSEETQDSNEHEMENLETEINVTEKDDINVTEKDDINVTEKDDINVTENDDISVTENDDVSNNTAGEIELKKKGLRLPNTTQHLLTHEGGLTDRVKAKLTNWNSVDKLTKGSMNDVTHLNDDPWVKNSETANSKINTEAEPSESLKLPMPTISKPLDKYDLSEITHVSNNNKTLDWLVYLNKNSTSLKYQSSLDEKRMSTPILSSRHSIVPLNLETKNKRWSQVSNDTPTGENMTYENMKRLGLIKDQNKDESFFQNKRGNNSSTSSRKVNAFGTSPTTITTARPISLSSSSGLFRSSSTPISEITNYPVAKAIFKERPSSLDIDILTSKGHRVRNESNKYLNNSSENVIDVNKVPNNLPSIKVKDEEAGSNNGSVISSTSASSHENQSSGPADGLIGRPESELHPWEKTSRSRPESDLQSWEKTSRSRPESDLQSWEKTSRSRPESDLQSWEKTSKIRPESELHPWEKTSRSRPESDLQSWEKTSKIRPESELHPWEKTSRSRPESEISCASTLTSEDENRDVYPRSGNTFEPPSKIRSSWKEDRQLETVLREHSLGSSKLGSRMANSITQPELITHHCLSSSDHESHPQDIYSADAINKTPEQSLRETNFPTQVKLSLTTTTEVTAKLEPSTLTNSNPPEPPRELAYLNNESNMKGFDPPQPEAALELSEQSSTERAFLDNQKRYKAKTASESSNFARSESSESSASTDSCYERKLSAAFDSDIFQEMPEFEKRNDRDHKEALLLKKSIRDYVKDIEEKFKAPSPKVVEVKRREPGVMIRQRLQTLKESALHGWRNSSISSSKLPNEESSLKYSNYDRRTLYISRDNSLDSNSNSVCLRHSRSRDSLLQSVDNLSKSRDNIFASRDSLSSMSMSRDSLLSLSNSPGYRHSAPVFSLKTANAGHEKDANRFNYKAPEESQTILGNQFVHRRTYGSSQSSLIESEMQSSQEKETGPAKTPKLMHQHSDHGNETDNLVVMKGWVRSLISKFQVHS